MRNKFNLSLVETSVNPLEGLSDANANLLTSRLKLATELQKLRVVTQKLRDLNSRMATNEKSF